MPTLLLCYKRSANCLYGTNHAPFTGLIKDNAFFLGLVLCGVIDLKVI